VANKRYIDRDTFLTGSTAFLRKDIQQIGDATHVVSIKAVFHSGTQYLLLNCWCRIPEDNHLVVTKSFVYTRIQ
jgi:hypothetical protein